MLLYTCSASGFNSNNVPHPSQNAWMRVHVPAQLCQKIWSHQYINIALLLKGNVELQDLCSGGLLHITDKGQLETRPKVTREKISNIEKWTDAFFVYLLQAFS